MNNPGTTGYPLTCDQASQILATTAGGAFDPAQWELAEAHLAACPHCRQAAAGLADAVLELSAIEELEAAWEAARSEPAAQEAAAVLPSRPFRWDALGQFIIQFSSTLLEALQPPTPRLSYGFKSAAGRKILYEYAIQRDAEDLEVTITVEENPDLPTECTVTVSVQIPSLGGWPNLADTQVTLKRAREAIATTATDAFGDAVFPGIAVADLPTLTFQILPVE